MRDINQPTPSWLRRIQVWALNDQFVVNCGYIPLEEATEVIVEALIYVLNNRGRKAEPIKNEAGEIRGIQW